ncbi:protein IQ-DOMAIN 31-like isoform X1 [Silene latifolia]|uniref:protein IQ-DOMAIN 31-like isoform X1 n=2 Tax=Silene latifolia TaxID=37657 RepID=UPI003D77440A
MLLSFVVKVQRCLLCVRRCISIFFLFIMHVFRICLKVSGSVLLTMRKSPGKWIKNVLFGKKSSKSNFAQGKEKRANGKEVHVRVMAPEASVDDNIQEVPSGGLGAIHVDEQKSSSMYKDASSTLQNQEIPAPIDQNADVELVMALDTSTNVERIAQEKAATKTQAAFRGYLARRAFKALKGIIRLQALIRGHLVRRQAVATLYCVIGIVKLQALVRGSTIRCSDAGIEVQRVCNVNPRDVHGDVVSTSTASLSENSFVRKLLAPSPQGMPLRVQYDETDSNSVEIWLERWSASCPWKLVSPPKKANSKVQKKQGNSHAAEGEITKPKRSVRKVPSAFDNASSQPASELEKPRRNPKKVSSHPADPVQENPQSELEKVKRSLRKVQNPVVTESPTPPVVTESSTPAEVTEGPPHSQAKTITSSVQEGPSPDEVKVKPVESMKEETVFISKEEVISVPEENEQETDEGPKETSQSTEIFNEEITKVKSDSIDGNEKDENTPVPNGALNKAVESMPSENQKSSRRASLPAKQDHVEDGLQNTRKLPSYMQATQSAKAKLREQGSPRLSQDSGEKNNVVRRHSLPSPANGKVGSGSPRTPKILQGSGKGGNKSDKSLLSSRDGNGKTTTQEWRR